MTDLIDINPGSDLVFNAVLTDAAGVIDITGAVLSVFEPHVALAAQVTLTVTDASEGAFRCLVKWSSAFPRDIIMPLRILLTQGDLATSWPAIKLRVPL